MPDAFAAVEVHICTSSEPIETVSSFPLFGFGTVIFPPAVSIFNVLRMARGRVQKQDYLSPTTLAVKRRLSVS